MMRIICLLAVMMLGVFAAGCADRGVEVHPRGQMIIGGSVGGSTK